MIELIKHECVIFWSPSLFYPRRFPGSFLTLFTNPDVHCNSLEVLPIIKHFSCSSLSPVKKIEYISLHWFCFSVIIEVNQDE
ncbi:unnamed protein product [Lactuca virosa]|uniref:Uncharacterized protein n=1 Tax=Lactuca virosa TaxID=75947 RepID=A0AAU9NAZ0_9ASTR|nr:unnamed protein product [Lactuca virosa]